LGLCVGIDGFGLIIMLAIFYFEFLKKKKCSFCKDTFEGTGKMCPQCAEWED
jgi:predicted amidophosphoribosyltransferase